MLLRNIRQCSVPLRLQTRTLQRQHRLLLIRAVAVAIAIQITIPEHSTLIVIVGVIRFASSTEIVAQTLVMNVEIVGPSPQPYRLFITPRPRRRQRHHPQRLRQRGQLKILAMGILPRILHSPLMA